MSRFEFLQRDFPELYERCRQAEEATDIDVIMLKCRQTLEWMVKDLGGQQNNLFFDISELSDKGILPDNISHMFHNVRMVANRSVHKNETMSRVQAQNCLNQLLELTIWFAVQHDKKYDLTAFASQDVAVARKYLKSAKTAMGDESQTLEENASIDPLSLQEDFAIPEDEPQDILAKDVFETQAEYEQRIADMEPIHIGYGILDTRRKDGYTNVIFLIHHVDRNAKIQFADVDAFFANDAKVDGIVDDELVAKLKVYNGKVCCDYEKVYLRNDEDLIPLQVVKWDKFAYETNEDYKKRIENLPLIPFGVGYPVRSKYDLEHQTLPIMTKSFRYTEKVMDKLLSEDKILTIPCNRDMAKQLCNAHKKVIIFGKVSLPLKWTKYVLWEQTINTVYDYDLQRIEAKKREQKRKQEEKEYLRKLEAAQSDSERVEYLKALVDLGNTAAQKQLGDCYYEGKGVEQNYQKAIEYYNKSMSEWDNQTKDRISYSFYYLGNERAKEHKYQNAIECYRKAAEFSNIDAMKCLGDCYYEGKGIRKSFAKAIECYEQSIDKWNEQTKKQYAYAAYYLGTREAKNENYSEAIEWYKKSIAKGNSDAEKDLADAQVHLADCCFQGEKNKAVKLYQEAASLGNADAENMLGDCYYKGEGVIRNNHKAFCYYMKAAQQEHAEAQNNVGYCYFMGIGIAKNYLEANKYFEKSAQQGNINAKHFLSKVQYYLGNQKSVEYYKKAAEHGDSEAQYALGNCYCYGKGIKRNYKKAIGWYQKAAAGGSAKAQEILGDIYYTGQEIEQDYQQAVKWYEKAMKQGSASAKKKLGRLQELLGDFYYKGIGVEQNYEQAVEWYKKAAENGNIEAQNSLAFCYYYGNGVEQNYEQAVKWYQKAAEQEYAIAQNSLGDCYYYGIGVEQDYEQAIKWYRKAVDQGYSRGQYNLGRCYQYGNGTEQDKSKAIKWYQKAADQGFDDAKKKLQELLQERENPSVRRLKKSNSKSAGCFITTAVCTSFQKPDDCYELTQFRKFRDNWLSKQADGPSLINEYYRIAPSIVAQIDTRKDAKRIYKAIWENYLQPCLSFIESKDFTACKNLYIQMVRNLQAKYNS